jgi:hypothetical protein
MKRYYNLKRENKLTELTLSDGEALAQLLVEYAIKYSNDHPLECRGIGGSIHMLVLTAHGVEWVHVPDPSRQRPLLPLYHARVIDSTMPKYLDGLDFLRPKILANTTLLYAGEGNVRIVQPTFLGPCRLIFAPDAEKHKPDTVASLRQALGNSCDVYRDTNTGTTIKLSTADRPANPPPDEEPGHPLCNSELKQQAETVATQIRTLQSDETRRTIKEDTEQWNASQHIRSSEDAAVLAVKQSYGLKDRTNDFTSDYEGNIVPVAESMIRQMLTRISQPIQIQSAKERGWAPQEMSQVAADLEKLAAQLPDDGCKVSAK